jgi:peptide-methionine (R)-S-oxide reductase
MAKRTSSVLLVCAFLASTAVGFHNKPALAVASSPKRTMCFSSKENDTNEADVKRQTNNPLRLAVLRLGLTELAWTSPLNYGEKNGKFTCAYCGQDLFESDAKYNSGSGWPSFWRSSDEGAISYNMEFDGRSECKCGKCDSHLGHVFLDGPRPGEVNQDLLEGSPSSDPRSRRTDGRLPRFCVNGASLNLKEEN